MRHVFLLCLLVACDDEKAKGTPDASVPSASASVRVETPPEDGCVRASLDGAESDPACSLVKIPDGSMRELSKKIAVTVKPDAEEVVPGSETLLRVTLQNISNTDYLLVFDAYATPPTPRPDQSRLAGVKEDKTQEIAPRLRVEVVTLDGSNRPVDSLPTLPSVASSPKIIGIRLKPKAKLAASARWWALRIPAPPPVFEDDAGRRYFPKTTAIPLGKGEYTAQVELPFHGVAPYERLFTTKMRVGER